MRLFHRVPHAHEQFPFDGLGSDCVLILVLLRLQRRKLHAAAAKRAFARGKDHVSADRANIELPALHVAVAVGVLYALAGEQLRERHAEGLCQRFNEADVRQSSAGFPFGDGFVADHQHLRELLLRISFFLTQELNRAPGYIIVHVVLLLLWWLLRVLVEPG